MGQGHKTWLSVTVISVTTAVLLLQKYAGPWPGLPGVVQSLAQYGLWMVPPLAMLLLWHGPGGISPGRELGLAEDAVAGLGRATLAAAPFALAALLLAASWWSTALGLAERALLTAGLEGYLFRGFLFSQLYRRAGWGFIPAVAAGPLLLLLVNLPDGGGPTRPESWLLPLAVNAFLAWLWLEGGNNLWLSAGFHFWLHWGDSLLHLVTPPELAGWIRLMEGAALVWAAALVWGHRRARGGLRLTRQHLLRNPDPAEG